MLSEHEEYVLSDCYVCKERALMIRKYAEYSFDNEIEKGIVIEALIESLRNHGRLAHGMKEEME